jgi:hypothetical protein
MKIILLIVKWTLFVIGCALAGLIVFNIINVPRILLPNGLEYSLFWATWIGWGFVSYFSREPKLLDEYSKSHQIIHQLLNFLLHLAVFGVTLLAVFYICNSMPNPALSLPEADLNLPKVNIPVADLDNQFSSLPKCISPKCTNQMILTGVSVNS